MSSQSASTIEGCNRLEAAIFESDGGVVEDLSSNELPHFGAILYPARIVQQRSLAHTMPAARKIWLSKRNLTHKDATRPFLDAFPPLDNPIVPQTRTEGATIGLLPNDVLARIIRARMALLFWPSSGSRMDNTALKSLVDLALINRRFAGVVRSCEDVWAAMLRVAKTWRSFNAIRLLIGHSRLQVSTRTGLDRDHIQLMIRDIAVLELQPSSDGQGWIDVLNKLSPSQLDNLIELRINPALTLSSRRDSTFRPLKLNAHRLERLYTNVPVLPEQLSRNIAYLSLGPTFSHRKRGEDITTIYVNILAHLPRLHELIIYHPRGTASYVYDFGMWTILNMKTVLSVTSGSTFLHRFAFRREHDSRSRCIVHTRNGDSAGIHWPNVTTLEICGLILPIHAPRVQNCTMVDVYADPRQTTISEMVDINTLAIDSVVLDDAAPSVAPLALPKLASISYRSSMTKETGSFFDNISLTSCLRRVHLVVDLKKSCDIRAFVEGCQHTTIRNLFSLQSDGEDLGFTKTRHALSAHPYFQNNLELVAKFQLPSGNDDTSRVQFSVRRLHALTPDEHVVAHDNNDGLHVDVTLPNDVKCQTHPDDLPAYTCLGILRLLAYEGVTRICVKTLPSNDESSVPYAYDSEHLKNQNQGWVASDFNADNTEWGESLVNNERGRWRSPSPGFFTAKGQNPWKPAPRFNLLDPFRVTGEWAMPFLQKQLQVMQNVKEISVVICPRQEVVGNGLLAALSIECTDDDGNEIILLPNLEVLTILDESAAQECSRERTIEKRKSTPCFGRGVWYTELQGMTSRRARLANVGLCPVMRIIIKGDFDGLSAADAKRAQLHLERIRKNVPVEYQYLPTSA